MYKINHYAIIIMHDKCIIGFNVKSYKHINVFLINASFFYNWI